MFTKRKRRLLFYAAILAFFILLLPVLLYSLGYGIGPDFSLQKTGGIFIKASENGAALAANGKIKTTAFLTKTVIIKYLLPKTYRISVTKDGFWDWSKTLPVYPETVTSKNVLMIPKNINTDMLGTTTPKSVADLPELKKRAIYQNNKLMFSGVKKFWELPGGDFLILGDDDNFYKNADKYDASETLGMTAFNILRGQKNSFFDESLSSIIYWDAHNIDIYWFDDTEKMPQWAKEPQRAMNRWWHIFSADSPLGDVRMYPGWGDYLIVASEEGVYVMEIDSLGEQNIFPLYRGTAPKIALVAPGTLIILDNKKYIKVPLP